MNPFAIVKMLGVLLMAFVFYHFWQLWGLLLGCGLAMALLA